MGQAVCFVVTLHCDVGWDFDRQDFFVRLVDFKKKLFP